MPDLLQLLTPADVEKTLDDVGSLDRDELEACIDVEAFEIANLEKSIGSATDPRVKRELRGQVALKLQLVDGYRSELRYRFSA